MKIPLHIINGRQDKFSHVADDLVVVEDVNFKWLFSEFHDVAEIDGSIFFFGDFEEPFGAVVAAGRGVEDDVRFKFDKDERLNATGESCRWDFSKYGAVNDTAGQNDGFVYVENHFLDKWIDDPIVLVIIFKIDRCTVNRLRHISEKYV